MKLKAILVAVMTAVAVSAAATAPAYNAALAGRFADGDATLTDAQVNDVYYGAPGAPGFNPAPNFGVINSLRAERRYADLKRECETILAGDPTALTPLFRLYAAARGLGDNALANKVQWKVNALCDAIFASGKGVAAETPWLVSRVDDIAPFLTNYVQVTEILGMSALGNLQVAKVNYPGQSEPVYFYFKVVG